MRYTVICGTASDKRRTSYASVTCSTISRKRWARYFAVTCGTHQKNAVLHNLPSCHKELVKCWSKYFAVIGDTILGSTGLDMLLSHVAQHWENTLLHDLLSYAIQNQRSTKLDKLLSHVT